jgi:uncharacterized membrane protein
MNRNIRNISWYLFLAWSALELAINLGKFKSAALPALPAWIDFVFYTLAAANILFEAAAHVGWKKTWLSFLIVGAVGGGACYFGSTRIGPAYTPLMGPLIANTLPLALPLLWWTVIGGFYLLFRYLLPIFDPRVLALLTAVATLLFYTLLEPFAARVKLYWIWNQGSAPWLNYFSWLLLAFALARIIPLKGDSAPADFKRPLIAILIMLLIFAVRI